MAPWLVVAAINDAIGLVPSDGALGTAIAGLAGVVTALVVNARHMFPKSDGAS